MVPYRCQRSRNDRSNGFFVVRCETDFSHMENKKRFLLVGEHGSNSEVVM